MAFDIEIQNAYFPLAIKPLIMNDDLNNSETAPAILKRECFPRLKYEFHSRHQNVTFL